MEVNDKDFQRAIYESLRTSNSYQRCRSEHNTHGTNILRNQRNYSQRANTLAREGITSANITAFSSMKDEPRRPRTKSKPESPVRTSINFCGKSESDAKFSHRPNVTNRKPAPNHTPSTSLKDVNNINANAAKSHPTEIDPRISECISKLNRIFDESIVSSVMQDIVHTPSGVKFEDIAALPLAKRLLQEAVVLPLLAPELFTGIREPWRGVLLFGPPGTGKTMLAKAVSGIAGAIFFSISTSTIISKYRGDSEKIMKCLFTAARMLSPAIIFLDEIDAIASERGDDNEHEASRRLKTELFTQMDGLHNTTSDPQRIMVLAATNCPWDIDQALRRRLEKRLYIPLPDRNARTEILLLSLRGVSVATDVDHGELANDLEGFSGSDIRNICREAAMAPLRRLLTTGTGESEDKGGGGTSDGQKPRTTSIYEPSQIPPVTLADFQSAITSTKSSVARDMISKYESWNESFGAM
eukprot:gene9452-19633_t